MTGHFCFAFLLVRALNSPQTAFPDTRKRKRRRENGD